MQNSIVENSAKHALRVLVGGGAYQKGTPLQDSAFPHREGHQSTAARTQLSISFHQRVKKQRIKVTSTTWCMPPHAGIGEGMALIVHSGIEQVIGTGHASPYNIVATMSPRPINGRLM